jgi:hypothetical protein
VAGYIFLSYSHDDATYAAMLTRHLRGQGLDVWVDEQIRSGDRWDRSIKHKIDECSAFIVIMSPAAEDSRWVPEELERAISKGKPILPLLLVGEVIFGLARIQYLDVRGEALPPEEFVEWLREVCVAAAPAPEPPVLPAAAGPAPIGAPPLPPEPVAAPTSDLARTPTPETAGLRADVAELPEAGAPAEPVGAGHGPMMSMPRVIQPPSLRGGGGPGGPMTTGPAGAPPEPPQPDPDQAHGRPGYDEPRADPRSRPAVPWRIEPPPPPPGTPPVVTMRRHLKPPAGPPSSVDPSSDTDAETPPGP